jgi:uncharacterized membrane protein HdeD (DUF308 family)
MGTVMSDPSADVEHRLAKLWWLVLLAGIAWVVIAFVVLALNLTAVATIGYIVGFVLIAAGLNEFIALGDVESWKWLRIGFGVLCIIAGILALTQPFQTFGILALLIGWYLLFKGALSVIFSIVERDEIALWGLMLAAGIIEMVIGVWAIGYPVRSSWLLLIWVGIGALLRGITEIVAAFKLRGVKKHPYAVA